MSDSIFGAASHLNISRAHRWPTPWVFGVLILPLGVYVGYFSTALPFLLSKAGVPVDQVARIGSLLYVPPILMFLWAPVVDVKLRRRTWLILEASVTAFCLLVTSLLIGPSHLKLLMLPLFLGGCVVALVAASCGVLMATILSASAQSKATGWNQAGNFGGGVLGATLVLLLVEHLSPSAVGPFSHGRSGLAACIDCVHRSRTSAHTLPGFVGGKLPQDCPPEEYKGCSGCPEHPLRLCLRSVVEWCKLEDKSATQLERTRIVCRAGVGVKLRTPESVHVTREIRVI